jgi:hypothetical protein
MYNFLVVFKSLEPWFISIFYTFKVIIKTSSKTYQYVHFDPLKSIIKFFVLKKWDGWGVTYLAYLSGPPTTKKKNGN